MQLISFICQSSHIFFLKNAPHTVDIAVRGGTNTYIEQIQNLSEKTLKF